MKIFQKRPVAAVVLILAIVVSIGIGQAKKPADTGPASTAIQGSYTYVYDDQGVLSDKTCSHIDAINESLFAQTGAQIAVEVISNTGSQDIATYADNEFNRLGVGSAERNNGVLLFLALDNYYNGQPGSPQQEMISSFIVGNSLLNAQGIPMCGEFDLKTCIAMFIMDRLNIGGSFAEFHPFDFDEGFIFVGHDGPHHIAIAEGKPVLRSLKAYHGKPGSGASVEFKIKEGPITMLGLTQTGDGRFKFVIGEGMSAKGPIPPTGNTNTRGFFEPDARTFIKKWVMAGPTHHYALGIGHHAETIRKLAEVLGIEAEIIR